MTTSQRSLGRLKAPQGGRVGRAPICIRPTDATDHDPAHRAECPRRDTGTEAEEEAETNGQKTLIVL
jgi:hypothetical protein